MLTKKENIKNEVKASKNAKNASSQTHSESGTQPTKETKTAPQQPAATKEQREANHSDKKSASRTRITVKCDIGYSNQLYIRGKGANLSWDKGQPLKNVKPDEWIWETDTPFTQAEFKVLINDRIYENGENRPLNGGCNIVYSPHFY